MLDYSLLPEDLAELRKAHKETSGKREANRIRAVIALASGWSADEIARFLEIDPNTVRNHFKCYRDHGLEGLLRIGEGVGGSGCLLNEEQLGILEAHLQENLYQSAKDIANWVLENFGVSYTESGMTALLHRLDYVHKKPKPVPGKANREAQEKFLEEYNNLKENKNKDDPIYFMDATHPQHNPVVVNGWIKCGKEQEIPTNTGRKRVNINGAIDVENLEPVVRFDDTVNADSTIALFEQLEAINLVAIWIYVICDNARYYRSKAVKEYPKNSRIKLIFLPPYSPNLNLIERLWKFFKGKVLYNKYYGTFSEFKSACEEFFKNPRKYHHELRTILTENFAIIG